ncbi:DNA-binding protein [Pedobacter changchengzhani]|uniref:DNA-binding protein n=1 Tax=Pedobacter changchengzhani TaxID=2529274 RepID=A0A4V3A0C8_9SPHI|nr:HIRAN domain-containing protein [Pedobacter changchengzhani]TDG37113.1 DNA-binding protein [Pedobacter changchengzhani]
MEREHLGNFNIAGFTYYEGVMCFQDLKIGEKLSLKLEENNGYDKRAVAIYYNKFKLGFIPRNENQIFYKLLKVGLNCIDMRIQMVDGTTHPEAQIRVVAFLVNGDENQ